MMVCQNTKYSWEDSGDYAYEAASTSCTPSCTPKAVTSSTQTNPVFCRKSPVSIASSINDEKSSCDDFRADDIGEYLSFPISSLLNHKQTNIDVVVDIDVDFDFGVDDAEIDADVDVNADVDIGFNIDMNIDNELTTMTNGERWFDVKEPEPAAAKIQRRLHTSVNADPQRKVEQPLTNWFDIVESATTILPLIEPVISTEVNVFLNSNTSLESWYDDIDCVSVDHSTLLQDPVNFNVDIDIFGKSDVENWFDVVERRYLEEMEFFYKLEAFA